MDAHLVEATIKAYLTEIRSRLDKAAGIGRAADACAGAGFHEKGCRKSDQPDRPTKLSDLPPLEQTEKQATAPAGLQCESGRTQALIAVKRATILLRFDWLTASIGALL